MSPRGHYGFQKRQKEALRKAKQEAKKQRQADRAQRGDAGPEMGEAQNIAADPGVWEWFSPSRSRVATSPPKGRPEAGDPDDWVLLTEVGGGDESDTTS